jgi:hypothetical protein
MKTLHKKYVNINLQELTKSDDRAAAMLNLKSELREHIDKYVSAATHATRSVFILKLYLQ